MSEKANPTITPKVKNKLTSIETKVPVRETELNVSQHAIADPQGAQPGEMLSLQRIAGNQAVLRLIQTKLTVGAAGDHYEQEADRVADQVMSMPSPGENAQPAQRQEEEEEIQTKPISATISPLVQAQAEEEEEVQTSRSLQREGPDEEEEVQTKPLMQRAAPEEEEEVQAKPLIQRAAPEEEEEIQTKPLIQRAAPEEEEEIQTKSLLQREASEEEEEVQTKRIAQREGLEEEEEIQGKRGFDPAESFEAGSDVENRLSSSQGSGAPLPEDLRSDMETRFGSDFSDVRVHTGSESAQLNRALTAQAFTHGSDIYMGEGKFDTGSGGGKRLLAHELTHVIQQRGARKLSRKRIARKPTNLIQRGFFGRLWAWLKHKVDIAKHGDYYVWKKKGASPTRLIISSHGGYQHTDPDVKAPVTIKFYATRNETTDKQLTDVHGHQAEVAEAGQDVPDYMLSKYQGYHGNDAETYQDVAKFVETNDDYAILTVKGGGEIKYSQILGLMGGYGMVHALHCRVDVNPRYIPLPGFHPTH